MPIFDLKPHLNLGRIPKVKNGKLKPSYHGNLQTVEVMRRLVAERAGDPLVRKLALEILLYYNVPSNHYLDESKAIGKYILENMRYVRDPVGYEQLQDPVKMINEMRRGKAQGDCDDMSLLIASLLASIGHEPFFRIVRYGAGGGAYNHIYVVDYEKNGDRTRGKTRIVLDAIIKDRPIGFEIRHRSGREIPAVG